MENLLALTLADETPDQSEGEGPSFRWRWLGRGVLELTPKSSSALSLLLSSGIHGNEPHPLRSSMGCCARCIAARYPLRAACWWCLAIRLRWRKIKRYLVSDIKPHVRRSLVAVSAE